MGPGSRHGAGCVIRGRDPVLAAPLLRCYRLGMTSSRDLFSRIKAAARTLSAKLSLRRTAMIGTPPSERPLWHNPAAHARDFAERYAQDLDLIVAQRIQELGIPDHQNGRPIPPPVVGGVLSFHIRETAAAWSGIRSMRMPACSTRA